MAGLFDDEWPDGDCFSTYTKCPVCNVEDTGLGCYCDEEPVVVRGVAADHPGVLCAEFSGFVDLCHQEYTAQLKVGPPMFSSDASSPVEVLYPPHGDTALSPFHTRTFQQARLTTKIHRGKIWLLPTPNGVHSSLLALVMPHLLELKQALQEARQQRQQVCLNRLQRTPLDKALLPPLLLIVAEYLE